MVTGVSSMIAVCENKPVFIDCKIGNLDGPNNSEPCYHGNMPSRKEVIILRLKRSCMSCIHNGT